MAVLTGKLGTWELPHVHMWRDRAREIRFERTPLICRGTKVATVGSCFASEIAAAMTRMGMDSAMHPTGLFYTTRSVRQEIDRIFGGWPSYGADGLWETSKGFVHPFKDYNRSFPSVEEAQAWSDDLDRRGEALFRGADLIVITLGLIESWSNPVTGNHYRQIPHPEVFPRLNPVFSRLTTEQMREDLEAIRTAIREHSRADIIITVSPIPLHATVTPHDVRIANVESKHRIRAAVSEFTEAHPDVHYFHSYEITTTAEKSSDFFLEDGRHVSRRGVDFIVQQFLAKFTTAEVPVPELDLSWLTAPEKTAARPAQPPAPPWPLRIARGLLRQVKRFGRG